MDFHAIRLRQSKNVTKKQKVQFWGVQMHITDYIIITNFTSHTYQIQKQTAQLMKARNDVADYYQSYCLSLSFFRLRLQQ